MNLNIESSYKNYGNFRIFSHIMMDGCQDWLKDYYNLERELNLFPHLNRVGDFGEIYIQNFSIADSGKKNEQISQVWRVAFQVVGFLDASIERIDSLNCQEVNQNQGNLQLIDFSNGVWCSLELPLLNFSLNQLQLLSKGDLLLNNELQEILLANSKGGGWMRVQIPLYQNSSNPKINIEVKCQDLCS